MLVGLGDRLIRNRTQLSNAIRGYAAEFGFTAAKGMANLDPLLKSIQADESVPDLARGLFAAFGWHHPIFREDPLKVSEQLCPQFRCAYALSTMWHCKFAGALSESAALAPLIHRNTLSAKPCYQRGQFAHFVARAGNDIQRTEIMADRQVVICSPVRTAIGTYGGTLKDTLATSGAVVARTTLDRASCHRLTWAPSSWETSSRPATR